MIIAAKLAPAGHFDSCGWRIVKWLSHMSIRESPDPLVDMEHFSLAICPCFVHSMPNEHALSAQKLKQTELITERNIIIMKILQIRHEYGKSKPSRS